MKKIILAAAAITLTVSCSNVSDELGFEKSSASVTNTEKIMPKPPGTIMIGIFEVTLHRASKGCLHGFGFCNFEWFPELNPPKVPPFEMPKIDPLEGDGNRTVEVFKSPEGEYYFELENSVELPENLNVLDYTLVVDQDIKANTTKTLGYDLTLKAGTYSFDSNIGLYGGYHITLRKE